MIISPETAIKEGWITGAENATMTNAIDFTIDRIHHINEKNTFIVSEQSKTHRGGEQFLPTSDRGEEELHYWVLQPRTCYDGMSSMYVDIPEGVAAMLVTRSTFQRNGVYIQSGLYDSSFSGNIGFVIYNMSGLAKVYQGTRIGQIMFVESDSVGQYSGGYNHSAGTHWSES